MASVAMLIGGALVNALAFTGSSNLFHRLSADNIDTERKRHDAAIEKLQKAQIEWAHKRQQRIDFINNQLRIERKAEAKFTDSKNIQVCRFSVLNALKRTVCLVLNHVL